MKVIWFICNVLTTVKACVDPERAGFLKPPSHHYQPASEMPFEMVISLRVYWVKVF